MLRPEAQTFAAVRTLSIFSENRRGALSFFSQLFFGWWVKGEFPRLRGAGLGLEPDEPTDESGIPAGTGGARLKGSEGVTKDQGMIRGLPTRRHRGIEINLQAHQAL